MVFLQFLDSRLKGSPLDRAWGGGVRWTWVAPHADSGSGVGDCASSSSVSFRGGDEGTVSDHHMITAMLSLQHFISIASTRDLLE